MSKTLTREEKLAVDGIKRELGDVWKSPDGNGWYVQYPKGRVVYKTKRQAMSWSVVIKGQAVTETGTDKLAVAKDRLVAVNYDGYNALGGMNFKPWSVVRRKNVDSEWLVIEGFKTEAEALARRDELRDVPAAKQERGEYLGVIEGQKVYRLGDEHVELESGEVYSNEVAIDTAKSDANAKLTLAGQGWYSARKVAELEHNVDTQEMIGAAQVAVSKLKSGHYILNTQDRRELALINDKLFEMKARAIDRTLATKKGLGI